MHKSYDVIVAGAGSAGCALAYRLAKESTLEVLLLEAGSPVRNPMLHIPLGFAFLLKPHKNNWAYQTEPEKHLNDRRIDLPGGKVLGGCSAINSPKFLELSGIGQQDRLQALGIPVVHHLAGVGENLHDHWNSYIKQNVAGAKTYFSESKPLAMLRNLFRYLVSRKGLLANPAALIAVFYKSLDSASTPDAEIHFAPAASEFDAKGNMQPIDAITVATCGIRPTSRGAVHISSTDFHAPPAIELNFLASEYDQRVAIESLKKARVIIAQEALKPFVADEFEPGAQVQNDAQILEYIRNTGNPVNHLAGSCSMGQDAMAVVDAQLHVHGIQGLRVADASIMPEIVSGNTHASCVMIGEKCAAMILGS